MQLQYDGQVEGDDEEEENEEEEDEEEENGSGPHDDEYVYTADLQVEEPPLPTEADIEAGSPVPSLQRRQWRSQTMHLTRPTDFVAASSPPPTRTRRFSDTMARSEPASEPASASTSGWIGTEEEEEEEEATANPTTSFTSINNPDSPRTLLPNDLYVYGPGVETGSEASWTAHSEEEAYDDDNDVDDEDDEDRMDVD